MTIVWTMNADVALEFYERCAEREAHTEEQRLVILRELAEEGKMVSVMATERTKEQYVEDLNKNFNVLDVRPGEDHA